MENQSEKAVSGLKHLLSICNDGKEGYKNAAENVDSADLKALLHTYSIQRAEFASSLKTCIHQCGGDPDNNEGGPLGAIHRAWIDIKTALTSNDNKAVLDACITGEKAAIEAYDNVLEDTSISTETRQLLTTQRTGIQESLRNVEALEHQFTS
ncbi:MAG: family four-helix-bundle protein [Sphingobacteriaceae bacterium]|jgi:uncharacterized protein (TIGR02284 family)|nr:family four-helix-bundle protein [Sphingobacteriaceae bacterium]